jgi:hypothetical protein
MVIVYRFTDVELIHLFPCNSYRSQPSSSIAQVSLTTWPGVLIVSQSNELGVPEMIGSSPFEELNLRHGLWLEPQHPSSSLP